MNLTITGRRQTDLSYIAFIFLMPVTFYWICWSVCYFLIGGFLEGEIMMHSIIPRKVLGLPAPLIVFLLTSISLFFSVSAKLRKRTRWYKTPLRIRLAILLGAFFIFLVFLQFLM